MDPNWKRRAWIATVIVYLFTGGLLAWKETESIKSFKAKEHTRNEVIELPLSHGIDRSLAGKLVHVVGPLTTPETFSDEELHFQIPVISLIRTVEYWQVVETKEQKTIKDVYGNDSTIVKSSYKPNWVLKPIVKDGGYRALFTLKSDSFYAKDACLGPYHLSSSLVQRIKKEPVKVPDISYGSFIKASGISPIEQRFLSKGGVKMFQEDNTYFFGKDPSDPQVGDVRVTFTGVEPGGTYSVIALVDKDGSLTSEADANSITGIVAGDRSAEAMTGKYARRSNKGIWKLRLGLMLLFSLLALSLISDEKFAILKSVCIGVLAILAVISIVWVILRFKVGIFILLLTLLIAGYLFWLFHPKQPDVIIEDGKKPDTIDLTGGDGGTDGDAATDGSIGGTDPEEPEVFTLE